MPLTSVSWFAVILLIDNYDSFVHNLARYFRRLGQETIIARNDTISCDEIQRLAPQAIVLSPGPCTPTDAGNSVEIVRKLYREIPILGVCLGHQTIAAAFGAKIIRAMTPMHGRTSKVEHDGTGLFAELESPLTVCRYHSLVVDEATLAAEFAVTTRDDEDLIMAIQHRSLPLVGIQFHPEAILTDQGYRLLANFLQIAEITITVDINELVDSEIRVRPARPERIPQRPVTF